MIELELLGKLKTITAEEQRIIDGNVDIDRSIYMENTDNLISGSKLLGEGKIIALRPHTRFIHFPEHSHDFVEIVYMLKGSTTHIINGNKILLSEGELLFLCQNAKQEIMPAGYDDIAVNFIIRPEFFDFTLDMIGEEDTPLRGFLVDCLKNNRESNGYLHFEVSDLIPVQNLLENLIWILLCESKDKRNRTRITMGLLFLELTLNTDKLISQYGEEKTVVKVLRYIDDNYKDGSLTELAGLLHYDVSALSREIKSKTGKNYTELVQEKRLSQSCFLLKNTDMNIDEIADMTGYKNVSFFHRIFKSFYGVSPKKYRDLSKIQ